MEANCKIVESIFFAARICPPHPFEILARGPNILLFALETAPLRLPLSSTSSFSLPPSDPHLSLPSSAFHFRQVTTCTLVSRRASPLEKMLLDFSPPSLKDGRINAILVSHSLPALFSPLLLLRLRLPSLPPLFALPPHPPSSSKFAGWAVIGIRDNDLLPCSLPWLTASAARASDRAAFLASLQLRGASERARLRRGGREGEKRGKEGNLCRPEAQGQGIAFGGLPLGRRLSGARLHGPPFSAFFAEVHKDASLALSHTAIRSFLLFPSSALLFLSMCYGRFCGQVIVIDLKI